VPLALIKETLMQGAIYCGVPAANTGFKLTMQILRDEGLLPAAAPLSGATRVAVHHTFSQPQLAVAVQGAPGAAKAPIVLSHALGLDHRMWDSLAAQLAAAGHPVLRYDHRGHGASAVPTGPYTMDDLVDDAARLIREWGRGPVVWVGLSMGGMVGQGLGVRHPDLVRALVLANTTARYPAASRAVFEKRIEAVRQGGMAAIADSVLERYFSVTFRSIQTEATAAARAQLIRCDPAGYEACCIAVCQVDWLDRLSQIACPTLMIAGALDQGTPVAMSQSMVERVKGAELLVLDGAAHLSVVEQPVLFRAAMQDFLQRT
jgi:3-oxoadipate enol-lactonase